MGFFDLNIPYYESDRNITITDKKTLKTTRLKLIIKAMELGYTGIAYNRTFKGVMSESDRCNIPLFPLSSILKLSPSLSSTVEFRRKLLNVVVSSPFRQYTRLTVVVDSSSQASALNSGNPILKSYDIVAVRPLNQNAFEQACQVSEVDIIAIDFSDKLPFRLKQSMVKAAIQRGVHFEITYSSLISDAQMRRQIISNAKLLVDWTRGKNLLFSSAAPSLTELRGPYDVANLASLLGLQLERAKAALSKNCRTLITNALRKKCYHKDTIKVEPITSGIKEPEFDDWLKWDPISSGEGDLLLDDIKKSFSVSNNLSKPVKRIEFSSIVNNLPAHGLQIKDLISSTASEQVPMDTIALPSSRVSQQPRGVDFLPEECSTAEDDPHKIQQGSVSEEVRVPCLSIAPLNDAGNLEKEKENHRIDNEDIQFTVKLDIKDTSGTKMHDLQTETSSVSCEENAVLLDGATIHTCRRDIDDEMEITNKLNVQDTSDENKLCDSQPGTCSASGDGYAVLPKSAANHTCRTDSEVTLSANSSLADVFTLSKDAIDFHGQNGADGVVLIEERVNDNLKKEQFREMNSTILPDGSSNNENSHPMEVDNEYLVVEKVPSKNVMEQELKHTGDNAGISYQIRGGSLSGNMKRRKSYRPSLFPFKRLLKHRSSTFRG
ncbi:protein GAMETOPHYTE DEFECTIVE 1-like [Lycium barbarum]|uniref:protein GAMETOPHYTE DEFECTIVE 1-like n=1 Tax=Lycium barbarum TaxID=112863 RepID=UPI00293EE727|nr:protein GAMETOPHYTE DEFECTIVE 1-like [Lycium barbarum]